jgi:hypothetical protein
MSLRIQGGKVLSRTPPEHRNVGLGEASLNVGLESRLQKKERDGGGRRRAPLTNRPLPLTSGRPAIESKGEGGSGGNIRGDELLTSRPLPRASLALPTRGGAEKTGWRGGATAFCEEASTCCLGWGKGGAHQLAAPSDEWETGDRIQGKVGGGIPRGGASLTNRPLPPATLALP